MSGTHAKLSPSKAPRWLNCLGSVAMVGDREDTSSTYADEGTKAHAWGAYCLNGKPDPGVGWPVDEDMQSFVDVYVLAVCRAAEGKQLFVEVPVDISPFTGEPDAKGTADAVIVSIDGVLEVWDLKYGMGHMVFAENNEQLMIYALGVLHAIEPIVNVKTIKLVICQPRRDHLSEWTVSYEELMKFGEYVKVRAQQALTCEPGTNLTPSDKACLWCPIKTTCPALRELVMQNVMSDFDGQSVVVERMPATTENVEYPTPGVLDLVEMWLKSMTKAIFEKLQNFEPVPGWKLVQGDRKGNRKWKDEAAVEELLKSLRVTKGDSHESSLKSPAQLEKAGLSPKKWEAVAAHITQADAKPVMVSAEDPRPAVEPAKADEFEIFT